MTRRGDEKFMQGEREREEEKVGIQEREKIRVLEVGLVKKGK